MNPLYIQIGKNEDKVVEECAEVIHAIMKTKRFGPLNYHPDNPELLNKDRVLSEIKDLRYALDRYEEELKSYEDES